MFIRSLKNVQVKPAKSMTGSQLSHFTFGASSRAHRELKSISILHAHTCSARKNAASAADLGPPRQVLTCRVKSEDLRRKRTAPTRSVVFNFLTLSVMHGHNRQAEIGLPSCWAPARKFWWWWWGDYQASHSAVGTNRRCVAEPTFVSKTQTGVTDALAASLNIAKAGMKY